MKALSDLSQRWVRSAFPVAALVVPLLALTALNELSGTLLTRRVETLMLINLIMVLALQTFMGNSGVPSFGHVSFMLLGAYGSILFTMSPEQKAIGIPEMPSDWFIYDLHWPFLPSLLTIGIISAVVGGLIGIPLIRIGATTFGLVSFALLIVSRNIALSSDALTNGPRAVVGIDAYTTLWTATAWAVLFIAVVYLFKESGLGLRLRATREDVIAAAGLGINVWRIRWLAWVLSIFITAVAGGLWAHYVTTVSARDFWVPTVFAVMSMLVIGGQASVAGAVVGTVAVTVISEGVRTLEYTLNIQRLTNPTLQSLFPSEVVGLTQFVLAIVLILILVFRPSGIMGGREFSLPPVGGRARKRSTRPQLSRPPDAR